MKFIEEVPENIGLLKDPLKIIYFLLFPKIYNRMNRFGISNKSMLDFFSTNWRHHENIGFAPPRPIPLSAPESKKKKKNVPEIFVLEATQGKIEEGKNP